MTKATAQKLTAQQFRVLNFRNIDDSGWIPLEKVTCFVGRNESGKTTLLKALHKFNPAEPEPYNPQRDFPRDRFTAEYRDDREWPVCEVEFQLSDQFREELRERLDSKKIPKKATLTRYYSGKLCYEYDPDVSDDLVDPAQLVTALNDFAHNTRRLAAPTKDQEETVKDLRATLANWADTHRDTCEQLKDLRMPEGIQLLEQVKQESNNYGDPLSATLVEKLQSEVDPLRRRAKTPPIRKQINKAIIAALPIFIYFENYGILNSTVYLPQFIQDHNQNPKEPLIRTINAMFKQVNLTAEDIQDLGQENPNKETYGNIGEEIQKERDRKDLRSIKLNSASNDISEKFSQWFGQRRHKIKYDADGNHFRIWISDDQRPDVDIELENRSKGFQWFFSFYLVFLVESNESHKDAILLLDEPGLHLHPTAQQKLIAFFEKLSEDNQLIYTTHSPFLIDGEHLHRIRPVTEDKGHSRVSVGSWPSDRDTIFPLQAAAGYAMIKGLFQHRKNVLVEGISDLLYLSTLSQLCHAGDRQGLPDDIYITPCGGTKCVGQLASLFLGEKVRPIVLLDSDEAGRGRRDTLMKGLYKGQENAVLMLSDVIGKEECEIEDIIGEETILPILNNLLENTKVQLTKDDRSKSSLVDQIKNAAKRRNVELPNGWKAEIARQIVTQWSTTNSNDILPEILNKAEKLFKELMKRFDEIEL